MAFASLHNLMNATPPPLPVTPRKKDPLAVTAFVFGIIGIPIAMFSGILCLLGRSGGYGGLLLVGILLLALGIIIHIVMTVVSVITVIKRRSFLTISACALNIAVIPSVLLILILALS